MLLARFALPFSVGVEGHHLGKLSHITCPILHIVHFYFCLFFSGSPFSQLFSAVLHEFSSR